MAHTGYPAELADLDPFGLLETETARLDRHFTAVAAADRWAEPTAATGWSTRDMLAHLLHSHRYDRACLDGAIDALFAEAASSGVTDLDSFNDWGIREGRARGTGELLADWRRTGAEVRVRLRERGRDGTLPTMVGEYNVGLQVLHLAFEQSVHADDMSAAVAAEEDERRRAWRARFGRWSLANEKEDGATVEVRDGVNVVRAGGQEDRLSDDELILAFTARLPEERLPAGALRSGLRCLS